MVDVVRRDRRLMRWLVLFLTLNGMDLLTTFGGLQFGAHEVNPLLAFLFLRFGFVGGSLVKLLLALVMAINIVIAYPASPKWAYREAVAFCVLMAVIVVSNTLTLIGLLH